MTFEQFNAKIKDRFQEMQQYKLFRLNVTGQQVWDTYLKGFNKGDDPVFRDPNSTTHTCNNDQNFVRRYGNVVAITDKFEIMSLWDIDAKNTIYEEPLKAIWELLDSSKVENIFFETWEELNSLPYEKTNKNQDNFQLGHEKTLKKYTQEECDKFGVVSPDQIYTFHHLHVNLNKDFVDKSGKSIESIMGSYRDAYNVFKRGLTEISLDTLELVKDLIVQGSLLNGNSYLDKLKKFIMLKKEFDLTVNKHQDNWCWIKSQAMETAKFRNELIGTLCVELTEGKDLNKACEDWNKRVDPVNYMKAKSPITQRQIKEAEKFILENGYEESFKRRFATIDDIDVNEIRHMNITTESEKPAGLFAGVKPTKSTQHKRAEFDKVEEVSVDKFMKDILPNITGVEVFLENRMEDNLVSLTTANILDSKPIFKWSNNFSWSYKGNLAGKSEIKKAVEEMGGKVTGDVRASIMWAEQNGDNSDLDLHCKEPKFEIYYGQKTSPYTGGQLDVDIIQPQSQRPKGAVENIVYTDRNKMPSGKYEFFVHQFSFRNSQGFKAEIELEGETYQYIYPRPVQGNVVIAEVEKNGSTLTIKHHLKPTSASKEIWGLETNKFHKVNLVCLSPNHWGNNNIGNKHYFFMLEKCKSDEPLSSFHNENLIQELRDHRKVMEVLSQTTKLEPTKKQLAGLGFNATVKDNVILKLSGSHNRMIKLVF